MANYKDYRFVDGKVRTVIVDENGKIVNRNPNKDGLKSLCRYVGEIGINRFKQQYTNEELLECLKQFNKENGRPPTWKDLVISPKYPDHKTYWRRFGGLQKALKIVGLDTESTIRRGIIENTDQKARLAEIIIRDHFKNNPTDLAGICKNSPFDGICPNDQIYDVKGAKFNTERKLWFWALNNKYRDEIEIFFLLAFNKDWTKLEHAWMIPSEDIPVNYLQINLSCRLDGRDVDNMKEYEITDKVIEIINTILE